MSNEERKIKVSLAICLLREALVPGDSERLSIIHAVEGWEQELLQGERLMLEALQAVEEVCADAFTDEMGAGGHYTASYCPLCGGGSVCDEDCPRHLVVAAIKKATGK